jgi:triosephosphate isomerase (TIM)
MKNIWIIANWKSNKTIKDALDWISIVGPSIEKKDNIKVVVCPTFTVIEEVKKSILVGNFPLMVGSQDLSPYPEGAYTGEETATILKDVVELSILGHSERRQNFGETDEMVSEKVKQAQDSEIIPLVCVQEIETPVPENTKLVAYEPIFAIGSGNPDSPENAEKVANSLKQKYPDTLILYGGSVTSDNVKSFVSQNSINGVLVGKASLDPAEFIKIVQACYLI